MFKNHSFGIWCVCHTEKRKNFSLLYYSHAAFFVLLHAPKASKDFRYYFPIFPIKRKRLWWWNEFICEKCVKRTGFPFTFSVYSPYVCRYVQRKWMKWKSKKAEKLLKYFLAVSVYAFNDDFFICKFPSDLFKRFEEN